MIHYVSIQYLEKTNLCSLRNQVKYMPLFWQTRPSLPGRISYKYIQLAGYI